MIERAYSVDINVIERALKRSQELVQRKVVGHQEAGLRAARARDPRMMLALEDIAEQLDRAVESQHGRTLRGVSTSYADRTWPTLATMFREAYRTADAGNPEAGLIGCYGAAAVLSRIWE